MAKRSGKLRKPGRVSSGGNFGPPDQRRRPGDPSASTEQFGKDDFLIMLGLAVTTLAVYGQVVTHQFIGLDDDVYLRDNPAVASGLTGPGIRWAFTAFWDSNWHPLTWISHMIDFQLFGNNAGAHLLINALIHLVNGLLVFWFLRRVTRWKWSSAIVAGLFALHPLHVESVAWAVERKDTLSTFFGLLSLLAYARYAEKPSPSRYCAVALWLACGLMSKPMLVTWPFLFLLLDYWPLSRLKWQSANGVGRFVGALWPLIREKWLFFCLIAGSMIVTPIAQSQLANIPRVFDAPIGLRLCNALISYVQYIVLTFWPHDLAVYYPFPRSGIPIWQVALAVIVLLIITAVALREARERPWLIVGWLWFVGTLVPVIGLVQVGIGEAMADRYHYFPSIGLFVALVFGLADVTSRWQVGRFAVATAATVILLISASLAWAQTRSWQDTETLFEHTLSATSDNLVIEYNFGRVLGQKGDYEPAIQHLNEALRIKSDFFEALVNIGLYQMKLGKLDEAVSSYQRALALRPDSSSAHMQLALAFAHQDRKDDAVQQFYKARDLAPGDADIRANLGLTLARQGKLNEAKSELSEALRLNPESAEAHNNMGLVYLMEGEPEKSLPYFTNAANLRPNFTLARDNIVRAQKQIEARKK